LSRQQTLTTDTDPDPEAADVDGRRHAPYPTVEHISIRGISSRCRGSELLAVGRSGALIRPFHSIRFVHSFIHSFIQ
jgi:hypothetical protein